MILLVSMLTKTLDENNLEWVVREKDGASHLKIKPTIEGYFSWTGGSGTMKLYHPEHYVFLILSDQIYRTLFGRKESV